jgi:hypothetical protein
MEWHEVLRVSANASEAEVTAAYRAFAKRVHPDSDPAATASERRKHELAMATLNAAYEAAQRERRHANRVHRVTADGAAGRHDPDLSGAGPTIPGPTPDVDTAGVPRTAVRRRPFRRPVGVTLAFLVCCALAFAVLSHTRAPGLTVGSCVAWQGGFVGATCSQPHAGRVVSIETHPSACPSRSSFMHSDGRVLCIDTTR